MIADTTAVFKLTNDTLNAQTLKTRLDDLSKADSGWIKKDLTIESSKIARIVLAVFGWIPAVGRLVYHFYEIDARVSKENLEIIANSFNEEYHPFSLLESYEKAAKRFNSLMPNYKVGLEPKNIALDERPDSNPKLELINRSIKWLNNPKNVSCIQDACPSVAERVNAVVLSSRSQLNAWKGRIEAGESVPLPDYYHATREATTLSRIFKSGSLQQSVAMYGKGVFFSSRHEFGQYGDYAIAMDEEGLLEKPAEYFPLPKTLTTPVPETLTTPGMVTTMRVYNNSERPMWLRVRGNVDLNIRHIAYVIAKYDPWEHDGDQQIIENLTLKGQKVQIIRQDVADVIRLAFDYNKKKAASSLIWNYLYTFEKSNPTKRLVNVFQDDHMPFPRRMRHFTR